MFDGTHDSEKTKTITIQWLNGQKNTITIHENATWGELKQAFEQQTQIPIGAQQFKYKNTTLENTQLIKETITEDADSVNFIFMWNVHIENKLREQFSSVAPIGVDGLAQNQQLLQDAIAALNEMKTGEISADEKGKLYHELMAFYKRPALNYSIPPDLTEHFQKEIFIPALRAEIFKLEAIIEVTIKRQAASQVEPAASTTSSTTATLPEDDDEKTITCKDLLGRTETILIKGSATWSELKTQITIKLKLSPERENFTLIKNGAPINEHVPINQVVTDKATTIFIVYKNPAASSSRSSDTSSSSRPSEGSTNFESIKKAIIDAATTYKNKIDGSTSTTEGSNQPVGVCQTSSEYFTVRGNHGPTGANRAELFIKRVNHQPNLEKVLGVVWHQVKNEGGGWSEDSLKRMVINALEKLPCCQAPMDSHITNAEDAITFVRELRTKLGRRVKISLAPEFDEIADAPQKSFFSSLFS